MVDRALSQTFAGAMVDGRVRARLTVPVVAGVVIALLISNGGREPRFRELGLVVGG